MAAAPPSVPRDTPDPLHDLEPRFRTVFERAAVGVGRMRLDGTIAEANPALARFLGRTPEALVGMRGIDLVHPDDADHDHLQLRRLIAGEIESYTVEKRFVRADGTPVWAAVTASLARDRDGTPVEVIGAIVDVDNRRRAEAALRDLQLRQEALLMNVPAAVWLKAADGRYLAVNEAFARYVGRPAREVVGMLQAELLPAEAAARAAALDAEALVGGRVAVQDRLTLADGVERWFETVRTRFADASGRWAGIIGVSHDITERIHAERAVRDAQRRLHETQRIEAVGRLAGGIAHDYNNLLTVITSYADVVLQELGAESPAAADVREISTAAARAATLTRQLLAFSRRQVMRREPIDLAEVIGDMRLVLSRTLGEHVHVAIDAPADAAIVCADRAQLEQVLLNLALNARDAMPGGGTLRVSLGPATLDGAFVAAHPGSREGRYVVLRVRDDGCGMPPDVLGQAFEPFFTTKPKAEGAGLGLSTVYGIVKQLDGYVELASGVGEGTTASIWLPAVEAPRATPPAGSARHTPRGTETILLVEDEPAVRAVAGRVLRRDGYRVLEAPDGERAMALARAHGDDIHLVLTDVVMPRMSGRELVDGLRGAGLAPLVLYMSGYAEDAAIRLGEFAPGTSFLEKPFTVRALLERVRRVLDSRAADG